MKPRGCEGLSRVYTVVSCGCDWCFAVGSSNTRLWFHAFPLIRIPRDLTRLFLLVGFGSHPSWLSDNASSKELFAVRCWVHPTLLSLCVVSVGCASAGLSGGVPQPPGYRAAAPRMADGRAAPASLLPARGSGQQLPHHAWLHGLDRNSLGKP